MTAVAELIEEVLHLPRTDRSYLATKLLESLDEEDDEMSEDWKSELDRRLQDIDEGKVKMIPHAEVMANVRAMLEQIRLERAEKVS
jgi:putative addiction module component (TIGR02574 family)